MSLLVWCPLTKDLRNLGLAFSTVSNNGASYSSTGGKLGGCYTCAGNTISIPLNITATPNFSISWWMKIPSSMNTSSCQGTFISLPMTSSNYPSGWGETIYWMSYQKVKIFATNDLYFWVGAGASDFQYDQWAHWTITNETNGDKLALKLYINGVLRLSNATHSSNFRLTSGTISLTSPGSSYSVSYNDFRLYSHSLSPSEVKELSMGKILHIPGNEAGDVVHIANTEHTIANNNTTLNGSAFAVTAGKRYIVEFDCKSTVATDNNLCILMLYLSSASSGRTNYLWITVNTTTNYKRYSVTFTVPNNQVYGYLGWRNTNESSNTNNYIKNVVVRKEIGTVHDISGLHNDLTPSGSPGLTGDTKRYERAVRLQGGNVDTTSNNWSTAVYLKGTVNLPNPTAITISWWSKVNAYGRGGLITTSNTDTLGSDYTATILTDYDGILKLRSAGGVLSVSIGSWFDVGGGWHHHCFTYDGTTAKYYRDGVVKASLSLTGALDSMNTLGFGVTLAGGCVRQTDECLSDIRLYATALSAADILELYSLGN